jgi:hypothetical protein
MSLDSLEDLFADSMERIRKDEAHKRVVMKNASPEPAKKVSVLQLYSLPENWKAGRTLALIHEETRTVLGNFREFLHKSEKGARRLERVNEPTVVQAVEYVRGKEWITEERPIPAPERWTAEREVLLADLILPEFNVAAHEVGVKVCLAFGGIARVELMEHTQFLSPDARTVQTFPAGTNVLEVMSLESKIELRKELQNG